VLYRLGGDLLIRLPRRPGKSLDANLTHGVLSRLAPFLPVAIPALIAEGRPAAEYPASWGVLRWLDGDTPVEGHLTQPGPLAADLAGFLRALWRIDLSKFGLAGGPPAYRGGATNPVVADNARYAICEILADHHGISDQHPQRARIGPTR
jgi:aminoglycoside phosphotransferase (APT) family kinase protein